MGNCENQAEHENYCSICFTCQDCSEQAELHDRKRIADLEKQLNAEIVRGANQNNKLTRIINILADNTVGCPEDTIYDIADILGLTIAK